MLNRISEKYNIDFNILKIIIFIIFFLFMMLIIFFTKAKPNQKQVIQETVDKEKIVGLFNKINDNYSLSISKSINGEITNYYYYKSNIAQMYEKDNYLYFIYNKQTYKLNIDNKKMIKTKEKLDFMSDKFSSFELIKNIIKYCEFDYISNNKASCKIKYSDFLSEYNSIYNTDYSLNYDNIMKFDVIYSNNKIEEIIVDYSSINNIINYNIDNVYYEIKIINVDSNDFNILIDHYKDIIKK